MLGPTNIGRQSGLGTTVWRRRRCGSCPISAPTVVETDMFTPLTIHRFTGHAAGSIYGSARKRRDGTTHLKNLYICGNDQGLVGVVGTIIGGLSIANRHLLKVKKSLALNLGRPLKNPIA